MVLADVRGIHWPLQLGRRSDNALAQGDAVAYVLFAASKLFTDIDFLLVLIHKQNCAVVELKVVANDGEDLVQHSIQIESGEDRLAGVIQNGNFLD